MVGVPPLWRPSERGGVDRIVLHFILRSAIEPFFKAPTRKRQLQWLGTARHSEARQGAAQANHLYAHKAKTNSGGGRSAKCEQRGTGKGRGFTIKEERATKRRA